MKTTSILSFFALALAVQSAAIPKVPRQDAGSVMNSILGSLSGNSEDGNGNGAAAGQDAGDNSANGNSAGNNAANGNTADDNGSGDFGINLRRRQDMLSALAGSVSGSTLGSITGNSGDGNGNGADAGAGAGSGLSLIHI